MKITDPQWIEVPGVRSGDDFCVAINSDIDPKYTLMAVVLTKPNMKLQAKKLLDKIGVPSQFVTTLTMTRLGKKPAVYSNILRQINGKMGLDCYKLQ